MNNVVCVTAPEKEKRLFIRMFTFLKKQYAKSFLKRPGLKK
jgi:hypothetical protein